MNKKAIGHLLWGMWFFVLYIVLFSMGLPLMRLGNAMHSSQILALIVVGETISFSPFFGVAKKNWGLSTPFQYFVFASLGFLMATNFFAQIICSQVMPIGDFHALVIASSMILIPAFSLSMHRRCINPEDGFGIVVAVAGVVLVARPTFLFGADENQESTPVYAYLLAIYCGFPLTMSNFVIGYYSKVHWTTYIGTRTCCTAIVAAIGLTATGHWTHSPPLHLQEHRVSGGERQLMANSIMASLVYGIMTNVFRTSSVFGCQELEMFAVGTAGVLGGIVKVATLAVSACYAYLYFGEVMTPMAITGAVLISCAILTVVGVRLLRSTLKIEKKEEDEDQKSTLLSED